MNKYLTRQEYCLGVRCPGLLWTLYNRPDTLSPYSERNVINMHNREAARLYTSSVSGVVTVMEKSIDEAAESTKRALRDGVLDIAGATFISGALSAECDLIRRRSDGTYALYIVRAAAHIRQTVCHDASYQVFVLATQGIRVSRVFFVKLNTCYVKGQSDERELFLLENISSRVAALVAGVAGRARGMLSAASKKEMPSQPVHNGCFNPSDCENKATCFACLPEDNVFTFSGVSHETKFKLYRRHKYTFEDMMSEGVLSPLQKKQMEMYLKGAPPAVDKDNLKKFLSGLRYPMCYLDFETMQLPFPPFEGLRPFEPCAFQFSLHIRESEGGPLKHISCIAKPGEDPRRRIAEELCRHIPENACVAAYNMQLEKMMVLSLAERFPDLCKRLMGIASNIVDMMRPFEKRWYYDGKMKGACSLKAVLHALYPDEKELDYALLEGVHNGQEATTVYAAMSAEPETFPNREEVLRELESYCALDTLALVKLHEKLLSAVSDR
ncbi:MAG: DUF2779 domain-containing protein [Clostridia bacterium]|nr:DUF2779 domain-containing protein [Clostridia bacterium]